MADNNENPRATKRPADTAILQQRMKGWKPILDPAWVIGSFIIIGAIFILTGLILGRQQEAITEIAMEYDSYANSTDDALCGIGENANAKKTCKLPPFTIKEDLKPPILIYYELSDFYQNHRRYFFSRDELQLQGKPRDKKKPHQCEPLLKLGDIELNPCGLFANTFFNDIFHLVEGEDETGDPLEMIEDGIAWKSDIEVRFHQPRGFYYEQCTSCADCSCEGLEWSCKTPWKDPKDGSCYRYFYPHDDKTQYLYETYPMVIDPIQGVTNEHFIVWMKTATLPKFRKLYGFINQPIRKGTELRFEVTANYEVSSFNGTKSLIISTSNAFGGKNDFIGPNFLAVGVIHLVFGVLFGLKHWLAPRKFGDSMYLRYKED